MVVQRARIHPVGSTDGDGGGGGGSAAGARDPQQDNPDQDFTRIELDLDALDDVVKPWFWAYASMCFKLQHLLDAFQGWAEDCACHDRLLAERATDGPAPQDTRLARYGVRYVSSASCW